MDRLKDKVSALKYFDLWNFQFDQLEEEQDALPFPLPAAFLRFGPNTNWESLGRLKQQALVEFSIVLGTESVIDTSNLGKDRNLGLEHLELVDMVFAALHGFSGTGFGTISRTMANIDHEHSNLHVTEISFKSLLTDTAAMLTQVAIEDLPQDIDSEFLPVDVV